MAKTQSKEEYWALEYLKCRQNILYFIDNYVKVPEVGGLFKYELSEVNPKLIRVVKSIIRWHRALLMASRQLGKALSIYTPIQLSSGLFVTMESVQPGDIILDHNEHKTKVVAVTDILEGRPCYEIEFDNSEKIIADADHLWLVSNFNTKNILLKTIDLFTQFQKDKSYYIEKSHFKIFKIVQIKSIKSVPVKCIQVNNLKGMYLCGRSKIPTHNSTIAAILIEWAMNFFPGNRAVILNMKKDAAQNNLRYIKFIHNNLPSELLSLNRFKNKAQTKTYVEYSNDSRIDTFYPSSQTGPDTLARSLTSPILYIDEAAFIRHIEQGYTSAQPVLSTAREQAKRNGFPYFVLFTSTPNGTAGHGKFFYDLWNNSIDSDDLFENDSRIIKDKNINEIVNSPSKNGFTRVKFHWSEDKRKDDKWYIEQKKELNFNSRAINQELDLLFVGGNNCIFEDDYLSKLTPSKQLETIELPHYSQLKIYDSITPLDFYLIGVDSARSLTGDFCAIEIYSYSEFKQIGEFFNRLGSITNFTDIIAEVVEFFLKRCDKRIILAIEENNIGSAIIENLEDDYGDYIYSAIGKPDKKGGVGTLRKGVNTNLKTKDIMVSVFYDYICKNPENIKSADLISQLSIIEKKVNGSVAAQRGHHDDLFMASCLCAYVKKLSALEYAHLIHTSNKDITEQNSALLSTLAISSKNDVDEKKKNMNRILYTNEEELEEIKNDEEIILPLFY